jgi:hypothetical protein
MKLIALISCISFMHLSILTYSQTKTYQGAWFEVKYPQDFKAHGSLLSATSDGFDSAFFTSPDGTVSFYVYSPQWSGDAKDIALQTNEKLASSKEEKSDVKSVEWWTIIAKDQSYTRSYQKTTDMTSNTIHVIGIKYKNQAAYERFKKQYISFKSSLKQFAD